MCRPHKLVLAVGKELNGQRGDVRGRADRRRTESEPNSFCSTPRFCNQTRSYRERTAKHEKRFRGRAHQGLFRPHRSSVQKASRWAARVHSKKQIRQIANSIQRFGFTNPVLIRDDGEIIVGHGRVEAAKLIGLAAVPVSTTP
jgi:hypothetical protein